MRALSWDRVLAVEFLLWIEMEIEVTVKSINVLSMDGGSSFVCKRALNEALSGLNERRSAAVALQD